MTIGELKAKINDLPDDMEVMLDPGAMGVYEAAWSGYANVYAFEGEEGFEIDDEEVTDSMVRAFVIG